MRIIAGPSRLSRCGRVLNRRQFARVRVLFNPYWDVIVAPGYLRRFIRLAWNAANPSEFIESLAADAFPAIACEV